jgi:hypothetical protein
VVLLLRDIARSEVGRGRCRGNHPGTPAYVHAEVCDAVQADDGSRSRLCVRLQRLFLEPEQLSGETDESLRRWKSQDWIRPFRPLFEEASNGNRFVLFTPVDFLSKGHNEAEFVFENGSDHARSNDSCRNHAGGDGVRREHRNGFILAIASARSIYSTESNEKTHIHQVTHQAHVIVWNARTGTVYFVTERNRLCVI